MLYSSRPEVIWFRLRSVHTSRVHGPCSRAVLRKSIARQCFFGDTGRVHGCARVPGSHGPWTRALNTGREHGWKKHTRVHGPCPRTVNTGREHGSCEPTFRFASREMVGSCNASKKSQLTLLHKDLLPKLADDCHDSLRSDFCLPVRYVYY